jgi:P-type conjugative transfer protein TrbL
MNARTRLTLAIFVAIAFALPAAAGAQVTFDPTQAGQAAVSTITAMFGAAQNLAKGLFLGIFAIEIVIFGIQMVLHRDNLAEFFSSLTMKILGFGFFAWLIVNYNLIGQAITGFQQAANQIAGGGSPTTLVTLMLTNAAAAFTAAGIAEVTDLTTGGIEGVFALGNGDAGAAISGALGHIVFEPVVIGIAGMEMMGAFAVAFQWILIQIEIAIVSSVGVFFLAFSTSRYTAQYSQGVLSYMFNVGAKLIAFQIFIAVATNLIAGQTIWNVAALAAAAALPDGVGSLLAVALAAVGGFFALLIGALSIAVPGFASSFMTGATTVSGQAALSNAVAGMAGAQALRAGMLQESQFANQRTQHLERMQAMGFGSSTSSTQHSANETLLNTTAAQAGANAAQFGGDEAAPHTFAPSGNLYNIGNVSPNSTGSLITDASVGPVLSNADTAMSIPLTGNTRNDAAAMAMNASSQAAFVGTGSSLYGLTADEMKALPDSVFRSRLSQTSAAELSDGVAQAIQSDDHLRNLALQQLRSESGELAVREAFAGNYAFSGLSQMTPKGEMPQSAVQVRIEHKD